jgi:hypothetical protein
MQDNPKEKKAVIFYLFCWYYVGEGLAAIGREKIMLSVYLERKNCIHG